MDGYKTYVTGLALIIHQILKSMGMDVDNQNLSIAIDVILGIGVVIFRKMAKPKTKEPVIPSGLPGN